LNENGIDTLEKLEKFYEAGNIKAPMHKSIVKNFIASEKEKNLS